MCAKLFWESDSSQVSMAKAVVSRTGHVVSRNYTPKDLKPGDIGLQVRIDWGRTNKELTTDQKQAQEDVAEQLIDFFESKALGFNGTLKRGAVVKITRRDDNVFYAIVVKDTGSILRLQKFDEQGFLVLTTASLEKDDVEEILFRKSKPGLLQTIYEKQGRLVRDFYLEWARDDVIFKALTETGAYDDPDNDGNDDLLEWLYLHKTPRRFPMSFKWVSANYPRCTYDWFKARETPFRTTIMGWIATSSKPDKDFPILDQHPRLEALAQIPDEDLESKVIPFLNEARYPAVLETMKRLPQNKRPHHYLIELLTAAFERKIFKGNDEASEAMMEVLLLCNESEIEFSVLPPKAYKTCGTIKYDSWKLEGGSKTLGRGTCTTLDSFIRYRGLYTIDMTTKMRRMRVFESAPHSLFSELETGFSESQLPEWINYYCRRGFKDCEERWSFLKAIPEEPDTSLFDLKLLQQVIHFLIKTSCGNDESMLRMFAILRKLGQSCCRAMKLDPAVIHSKEVSQKVKAEAIVVCMEIGLVPTISAYPQEKAAYAKDHLPYIAEAFPSLADKHRLTFVREHWVFHTSCEPTDFCRDLKDELLKAGLSQKAANKLFIQ